MIFFPLACSDLKKICSCHGFVKSALNSKGVHEFERGRKKNMATDFAISCLRWREMELPPPADVKRTSSAPYRPRLRKIKIDASFADSTYIDIRGDYCARCGVFVSNNAMGPRIRNHWLRGVEIYCNECFFAHDELHHLSGRHDVAGRLETGKVGNN